MKRFSVFGVLLLFLLFTMTGCVRDDQLVEFLAHLIPGIF